MFARNIKIPLGILLISLVFAACGGGMDSVFSSGGTYYRVNAMVNKNSLESYSIIRKGDEIHPYFVNSVNNDPDIMGLTVYLQTLSGEVVSSRVQYTLKDENEENQAELDPALEFGPETPGAAEETLPGGAEGVPPGTREAGEQTVPETGAEPAPEGPPETGEAGDRGVPETSGEPAAASPSPAVSEGGTGEGAPEKNPSEEAAPAEPQGQTETAREPGSPELPLAETAAEEAVQELVIHVRELDRDLPAFPLPENLEIGRYIMVFQVLGAKDTLYKSEIPCYFLGDAELVLEDISSFLPGVSSGAHLIPPGINIMLEALIGSDSRLDPYLIWYSGKKVIAQGRLADGANYLFWRAPRQTGFQTLRVEVLPFQPFQNTRGMIKELSLPISPKYENLGYFSGMADQYDLWYKFEGNLEDTNAQTDSRKMLVAQGARRLHWRPGGGIYGLVVGPEDIYQLPGTPFALPEKERGSGRILFRFKPLAGGTVFKAVFRTVGNSPDVLELYLSYYNGALVFDITLASEEYEKIAIPVPAGAEDYITAAVNFEIRQDRFTAQLEIENLGKFTEKKTVPLTSPLSGLGTFQLGESPRTGAGLNGETEGNNLSYAQLNTRLPVFILDELAVLYTRKPDIEEEVPEADAEIPDLSKTEQENPEAI
jgi:hypothetical protein